MKRVLFDSIFFTHSLAILFYCVYLVLWMSGATDFSFDKEYAAAHMVPIVYIVAVTLALMAGVSYLFKSTGRTTLGDFLFASASRKQHLATIPFFHSFWGIHLTITFFLTVFVSTQVTQFSLFELADEDGWTGAVRLFGDLFHANLGLLPTAIVEVIETIFIAFLGTTIAIPIAFLMCFACAKNIMVHPVAFSTYLLLRAALNLIRSVEPLIWAIIFTVWVGVGPFAGMMALTIHSIASLAKQYSELVESVEQGPIDGIRSTGANAIQVIWFAIVPQVVLPFISFTIYRWDINVRMATVIGLVGGGGIGTLLIKYQGQAMWPEVGCIIIVIAAVVWLMDTASAYIREALK